MQQHQHLAPAARRPAEPGQPCLDHLCRQGLDGHRAKRGQQLGVEDPAIALDRPRLALAIELDVADPLLRRLGEQHARRVLNRQLAVADGAIDAQGMSGRTAPSQISGHIPDTVRETIRPEAAEKPHYLGLLEADGETRTPDPFITSEVLYQLSYVGLCSAVSSEDRVPRMAVGAPNAARDALRCGQA